MSFEACIQEVLTEMLSHTSFKTEVSEYSPGFRKVNFQFQISPKANPNCFMEKFSQKLYQRLTEQGWPKNTYGPIEVIPQTTKRVSIKERAIIFSGFKFPVEIEKKII